ncbi:major facilitator superfamily domain-containing protein 12-like isoform X2 [Bacillus rossius redtenbacheri]|uniref:major facilitator superfamily domain-containing protein 12-like isoform X2 n=1 Tax=Bacillus rossius redtenbacheri TaxID=93214 RepID=UPI002FDE59B7
MMENTRRLSNDYSEMTRRLPLKLRLSYGVGHVLNDICASMWFTYLLVYFHLVLQFDSFLSGTILLVGQVADALSTPFVGIHSDKDDDFWLCKYGRRKTWHLIGTVCVIGSFPFIFSPCLGCRDSSHVAQMVYYSAFVIIFQFGWAAVQISHLSLIPDLTPSEHERTGLIVIRYSFTVCSSLMIYFITWGIFHMTNDITGAPIGPSDTVKFQQIVAAGLCVGAATSLVFHVFVKEGPAQAGEHVSAVGQSKRTLACVLQDVRLYQVAVVYTATRLFCNLSQVYVPLYLHESLRLGAESLAVVPLVMFVASFVMSLFAKALNRRTGRKIAFMFGGVLGIGGCVWIYFGIGAQYATYEIYAAACLLGAGSSVMLVTSLGITADFIGINTNNGAFVYGSMSFVDKLANGVAVIIIQYMKCSSGCPMYYRDILSFACGGAAVLGLVLNHLTKRLTKTIILNRKW